MRKQLEEELTQCQEQVATVTKKLKQLKECDKNVQLGVELHDLLCPLKYNSICCDCGYYSHEDLSGISPEYYKLADKILKLTDLETAVAIFAVLQE